MSEKTIKLWNVNEGTYFPFSATFKFVDSQFSSDAQFLLIADLNSYTDSYQRAQSKYFLTSYNIAGNNSKNFTISWALYSQIMPNQGFNYFLIKTSGKDNYSLRTTYYTVSDIKQIDFVTSEILTFINNGLVAYSYKDPKLQHKIFFSNPTTPTNPKPLFECLYEYEDEDTTWKKIDTVKDRCPEGFSILQLVWNNKNQILASLNSNNTITIWQIDKVNPLEKIPVKDVLSIYWSSGNSYLIAVTKTGISTRSYQAKKWFPQFNAHTLYINSLKLNPKKERYVLVIVDKQLQIVDLITSEVIVNFQSSQILDADWSPTGLKVVTAHDDGYIKIWNVDQFLD